VIKMTVKQSILSKHIQGISNREIARELHVSKNTVNKYVSEYDEMHHKLNAANPSMDPNEIISGFTERPKYDSSGRTRRKLSSEMIEIINECLRENEAKRARGRRKQAMKKKDIWEYVCGKGYEISYPTISNYIREVEDSCKEAFIRQDYKPGDTCEFDWGEVELSIGGRKPKLYQMAVFTPPYSDDRFAVLYEHQDTAAFLEAHADYFEYCNGVFRIMVYDNMKVAVKRFVGPTEKEPTESLLSLSLYYGFKFRFCNIASGNEKGDVERSVEFVRRKVFAPPGCDKFETLADANKFLREQMGKLNRLCNDESPSHAERFEQEQKLLLPPMKRYECCMKLHAKVDKYSTFVFAGNHYSVPDDLVGKTVDIRVYTNSIAIFYDGNAVARHGRSYCSKDWVIDIYHYLKTLNKKPGALPQSTALLQADTQVKELYESYYTKNVREFLLVLEIIREKGVFEVCKAIKTLELLSPNDYSADKIKTICETRSGTGESSPGSDQISEYSKGTLVIYDNLRNALSRKAAI